MCMYRYRMQIRKENTMNIDRDANKKRINIGLSNNFWVYYSCFFFSLFESYFHNFTSTSLLHFAQLVCEILLFKFSIFSRTFIC